jgi:KDO2-lipid IV(A) lauroyltransferase
MRLGWLNVRKGLLLVLMPWLRLLPPGLALRFVSALGGAEYTLNPALRHRYDAALSRAAGHFGCHWDLPSVGRALAGNQLRWRVRDHLLDGVPDDRAAPILAAQGRDELDAALAEGKGVILLFNHFGAFLMPAHWLVRHGYPLRWFTERPRNISKMLARTFASDGPTGQRKLFMSRKADRPEGATAIRQAVRILQAGMIVQVAGDVRGTGPRSAPARFLGRTYTFTTTWISLAALAGAPVVPSFGRMEPDGSYLVEFLPAFHVPPDAAKAGLASPWVQRVLDLIEERVRLNPANSSDYFFWEETGEYLAE